MQTFSKFVQDFLKYFLKIPSDQDTKNSIFSRYVTLLHETEKTTKVTLNGF